MKVCKFGGTSLASASQIRKVCDIVLADPERRIVVVSAPGKRDPRDTKVTDLLIACAQKRLAGEDYEPVLAAVLRRFAALREELGLAVAVQEQIERDLRTRIGMDLSHREHFLDTMKAAGEANTALVVTAALQQRGVAVRSVCPREAGLLLSSEYGNATILPESYTRLAALRHYEGIQVFPGFYGYTQEGHVVTFPRGGSDITGAILAAAVGATIYENFTDVDGVFAADPAIVWDAVPIAEMTYREMRELSYSGFSVLHDEAIIPAVRAGIPICIKNTNRPELPGTTIVPEHRHATPRVVGIASSAGFCTVFVEKYLMNREVGFGRRLLQIFEEEGISFEHTPSGIDNMSVIVREQQFGPEVEQRVGEVIRTRLAVDALRVERGLALIMVVGEGMRYQVGIAARATRALADASVNIEMMNQGSSEISMMFGVKAEEREKAVRALYDAFFRHKGRDAAEQQA